MIGDESHPSKAQVGRQNFLSHSNDVTIIRLTGEHKESSSSNNKKFQLSQRLPFNQYNKFLATITLIYLTRTLEGNLKATFLNIWKQVFLLDSFSQKTSVMPHPFAASPSM